jgi:hypothetical protein
MLDVYVQLVMAIRASATRYFWFKMQPSTPRFELKNFGHVLTYSLTDYLCSRSTFAKARSRMPESRMKPSASAC